MIEWRLHGGNCIELEWWQSRGNFLVASLNGGDRMVLAWGRLHGICMLSSALFDVHGSARFCHDFERIVFTG